MAEADDVPSDPQDDLAAAVLRPLRAHHAFESCVEMLATSIRLGIYPDGTTLPPERELAERMGVSRSTLRDAIGALRDAGLLTTRRGRGGGSVVEFRPEEPGASAKLERPREELLDALAFRRIVEPGAAHAAARSYVDRASRPRCSAPRSNGSARRRARPCTARPTRSSTSRSPR